VTEAVVDADVFIGYIYAAGEGDFPVDNCNLSVVAVVEELIERGFVRIKRGGLKA
jgi:hypothetical protein